MEELLMDLSRWIMAITCIAFSLQSVIRGRAIILAVAASLIAFSAISFVFNDYNIFTVLAVNIGTSLLVGWALFFSSKIHEMD